MISSLLLTHVVLSVSSEQAFFTTLCAPMLFRKGLNSQYTQRLHDWYQVVPIQMDQRASYWWAHSKIEWLVLSCVCQYGPGRYCQIFGFDVWGSGVYREKGWWEKVRAEKELKDIDEHLPATTSFCAPEQSIKAKWKSQKEYHFQTKTVLA